MFISTYFMPLGSKLSEFVFVFPHFQMKLYDDYGED